MASVRVPWLQRREPLSDMDVYFVTRYAFVELPDVRLFTRDGERGGIEVRAMWVRAGRKLGGRMTVPAQAVFEGDRMQAAFMARDFARSFARHIRVEVERG